MPASAWEMFQWLMRVLKLVDIGGQRAELVRLVNLTSGDFAAVQRHCRLDAVASGCELLVRLRKVSEVKREPVQKSIGFIG